MIEWNFRAADTYLAAECTDVANSVILGHPIGAGGAGYPAMSIWATIAPDDPNEREDIIITSISGAAATIVRGIGYSSGIAHRMGTPVRLGVRAGAYPHDFNNVVNFQNSWGNLGGAFEVASYRRHPSGLVEARGWVDGGTINTPCFTLPPGYRPGATQSFAVAENTVGTTYGRVDVETSGAFRIVRAPGGGVDLSCISYTAEA